MRRKRQGLQARMPALPGGDEEEASGVAGKDACAPRGVRSVRGCRQGCLRAQGMMMRKRHGLQAGMPALPGG